MYKVRPVHQCTYAYKPQSDTKSQPPARLYNNTALICTFYNTNIYLYIYISCINWPPPKISNSHKPIKSNWGLFQIGTYITNIKYHNPFFNSLFFSLASWYTFFIYRPQSRVLKLKQGIYGILLRAGPDES